MSDLSQRRCLRCGAPYEPGVNFCPKDGAPVGSAPATEHPFVGRVIDGRYRIDGHLGSGGMGTVYRGVQLAVERPVAVKVLRPELSSAAALVRFENEALIVGKLRHPGILKLIDYGRTEDGAVYMVTELLLGEPLDVRLARGPLTPPEVVELLRQVADALVEPHGQGIVHRDLKPANLFLERVNDRELVKVLDFGIAKLAESAQITQSGTVFGTPAYLAPEQARGKPVDGRTDLYSLGVVAFHGLVGKPPFTASSAPALLYEHVHTPPPSLEGRVAYPGLAEVVQRLLAKDPLHRFPSAAALRDHLVALERGATATWPEVLGPAPAAPPAPDTVAEAPVAPRVAVPISLPPPVPHRGPPGWLWAVALGVALAAVAMLALGRGVEVQAPLAPASEARAVAPAPPLPSAPAPSPPPPPVEHPDGPPPAGPLGTSFAPEPPARRSLERAAEVAPEPASARRRAPRPVRAPAAAPPPVVASEVAPPPQPPAGFIPVLTEPPAGR